MVNQALERRASATASRCCNSKISASNAAIRALLCCCRRQRCCCLTLAVVSWLFREKGQLRTYLLFPLPLRPPPPTPLARDVSGYRKPRSVATQFFSKEVPSLCSGFLITHACSGAGHEVRATESALCHCCRLPAPIVQFRSMHAVQRVRHCRNTACNISRASPQPVRSLKISCCELTTCVPSLAPSATTGTISCFPPCPALSYAPVPSLTPRLSTPSVTAPTSSPPTNCPEALRSSPPRRTAPATSSCPQPPPTPSSPSTPVPA